MLTVEMLRRVVAAADARRDPYAVAAASAALLEANAADGGAAGQYVRALVVLGLGDAARRMAAGMGKDAAALDAGLAGVVGGVIPWASRRRRFEANLQSIQGRGGRGEGVEGTAMGEEVVANLKAIWEGAAGCFELHQASDGNFQIFDLTQAAPWKGWLGGLDDHKGAATACHLDDTKNRLPAALAFDGIGHGWLLPHVLAATEKTFLNYSCAAYVVEPDPVAFCLALHLQDLRVWLGHPRLRVYVGEGAAARLAEDLERQAAWSLPKVFIANRLTRGAVDVAAAVAPVAAARQARMDQARGQIEAYYGGIDLMGWQRRFTEAAEGKSKPLRVLGVTTRYSTVLRYSMEELRAAVEATGHEMRISMEADDHSLENDYVGMIAAFKPDLIVVLSRMRYEIPDLPKNIPMLCWDQDNLPGMRDAGATADLNRLTYVAGHGALFGFMNLGWPKRNCIFLPAAAATHRYAPRALSAGERERYSCDFSFISNASGTPEALRDSLALQWVGTAEAAVFATASQRIIDSMAAPVTWDNFSIPALIAESAKALSVEMSAPALHNMHINLGTIADRCFRHTALHWVARWCAERKATLKLYGSGWEGHPVFKAFAAGPAAPGDEVRAICQATKINLQVMGTGFIHSRFLDGVAAGGFFLVHQGYTPEFEPKLSRELHEMATRVMALGLTSIAEIKRSDDAVIRSVWPRYVETKTMRNEAELFFNLAAWQEIRPPSASFPRIGELYFWSEESFRERAEQFLGDEGRRAALTAELRAAIVREYSYEAAFGRFVKHIRQGLAS